MPRPLRYSMFVDTYINERDQYKLRANMNPAADGMWVEGSDYDALRKHAEALVKALDNIGVTTDEDDILWTANHAINEFREAYPKEINHASGGDI